MVDVPRLNQTTPLEQILRKHLKGARHVEIAVAYAKCSGTDVLLDAGLPGSSRALVGVGFGLTEPGAVEQLVHAGTDVRLFLGDRNHSRESFHPKLYLIRKVNSLAVLSGSANLTAGGLGNNVEQFEEFIVGLRDAEAHLARFRRLWRMGTPFSLADKAWTEYREFYSKIAESRRRYEQRAQAASDEIWRRYAARQRRRKSAGRPATRPPAPRTPQPYSPRGYSALRPGEASTASQLRKKYRSLDNVRVAMTGTLAGTTRATVAAALRAAGAEVRNDNQGCAHSRSPPRWQQIAPRSKGWRAVDRVQRSPEAPVVRTFAVAHRPGSTGLSYMDEIEETLE
jgi:hypothetical protein